MKNNIKKSFIQLFIIYILAVINGSLWYIVFKNSLYAIIFILTVITGITIYLKTNHTNLEIWFKKPHRDAKNFIIVSSLIILFLMFLGFLMSKDTTFKFDIPIFISICLLSPLIEEIVCRGIIIDLLKEKYNSKHTIIISAIIFYIIHGSLMNLSVLLFGVLSAIMRLKSESIIPSLIWHFIWNSFIYFLPILTIYLA